MKYATDYRIEMCNQLTFSSASLIVCGILVTYVYHAWDFNRAGKILYRYKECLDPGPESNNLLDRFLHFLHFETVLLIFLSSFINIP